MFVTIFEMRYAYNKGRRIIQLHKWDKKDENFIKNKFD